MTGVPSPVTTGDLVRVRPGPALLAGVAEGPSLAAHRRRHGDLPRPSLTGLLELAGAAGLRGRGGAAFPWATKLEVVAGRRRRRPVVVVNASEGEPASAKDSALAQTRPHLVLDGAAATARALGTREVHVVLPGDRPRTARRLQHAVEERSDDIRIVTHTATPRFVAGQARAVLELVAGRPNLPVTAWAPEAIDGLDGRPTLLSNAETWAHVGLLVLGGAEAYRRLGPPEEPGTVLLTVTTSGAAAEVHELEYGAPLRDVLAPDLRGRPVLLGGFHGTWTAWSTVADLRVSVAGMAARGTPLGAGVVHVPAPGACPLEVTARIVGYLAVQSAGRCGPCIHGLPALAVEVDRILAGTGDRGRVEELAGLVTGRGACAHPDGTARLVRSLFTALPDEMSAHARGLCAARPCAEAS